MVKCQEENSRYREKQPCTIANGRKTTVQHSLPYWNAASAHLIDQCCPLHAQTALVRGYLIESHVGKMGGCHLFRHTVATLMLENGADIPVTQQMLGHANLTTAELYKRVSINLLRQVYSATHPAAHLKRPETPATTARDAAAVAELFDMLAAEAEEDSEEEETL